MTIVIRKRYLVNKILNNPTNQFSGGCKAYLSGQIYKCLLGHAPIKKLIPCMGSWTIKKESIGSHTKCTKPVIVQQYVWYQFLK
jgi:hypothetical protein